MTNTQSCYQFHFTFTPPTGEAPIAQGLTAASMLLLLDAIRRADRHIGRPTIAREVRLKNMLRARDELASRGLLTQETLAEAMGVGVKTIYRWITQDLKMTWSAFKDF